MAAMAAPAAVVAHEEEDAEVQIYAVDDYYFLSSKKVPVGFSTLPLRFGDATTVPQGSNSSNKLLFLRGLAGADADGGRHSVLKRVVAWRLELGGGQPELFVLARPADGGAWLRLANPRRFYQRTARTVLMTAQVLHFLRRNPDGPETALWIHLRQAFDGKFWPRLSENDFRNHTSLSLMRHFAAADPVLATSEALRAFVKRMSSKVGGAHIVDNYFFKGSKENFQLVCFSTLPLWLGAATADVPKGNRVLYLTGCIDGAFSVYNEVVAWRLEIDGEQPRFMVIPPADGVVSWLRLSKPAKLYERTARAPFITAQMLHFLRRNPDGPETALWIHLHQAFDNLWPGPSEDDFKNQTSLSLMKHFAATDPVLANSGVFRALVERISDEVVGVADIVYMADGEVIN